MGLSALFDDDDDDEDEDEDDDNDLFETGFAGADEEEEEEEGASGVVFNARGTRVSLAALRCASLQWVMEKKIYHKGEGLFINITIDNATNAFNFNQIVPCSSDWWTGISNTSGWFCGWNSLIFTDTNDNLMVTFIDNSLITKQGFCYRFL